MHFKRKTMPKFWPIARKGTKYVAVPSHNQYDSLPLVIVMRDILKLVKNRKELSKLLNEKQVLVNNKPVRETNYAISLFDIITLPAMKKSYKANLTELKKMEFLEVSGKEAETRIYKVIGKRILHKKIIQVNLIDGKNIFTKEKIKTGDSVLMDIKTNKIVKIMSLEKGKNVFIVDGKHAGKSGKINEIVSRGGKDIAKIASDKEKINVWMKSITVID